MIYVYSVIDSETLEKRDTFKDKTIINNVL